MSRFSIPADPEKRRGILRLTLTLLVIGVVVLVIVALAGSPHRPVREAATNAAADVASRLPALSSLSLWGALGLGACIAIWTAAVYGTFIFRARLIGAQSRMRDVEKRLEQLDGLVQAHVTAARDEFETYRESATELKRKLEHLVSIASILPRNSGPDFREPPSYSPPSPPRNSAGSIPLRPAAPPPEPGQKEICESFVEFCQTTEKDFAIAEASRFEKLLGEKYPQMKARVRSVFRDQVSGPNDTRIYADAAQARDPVTYWLVESGGRPVLLPAPRRLDQFAQIAPVFEAATTLQPRSLGEIHPPLIDITGDGWSLRKPGQVMRRPE